MRIYTVWRRLTCQFGAAVQYPVAQFELPGDAQKAIEEMDKVLGVIGKCPVIQDNGQALPVSQLLGEIGIIGIGHIIIDTEVQGPIVKPKSSIILS